MQAEYINALFESIPLILSIILLIKMGGRWAGYSPVSKLRAIFVAVACCILIFSQFNLWWSTIFDSNQSDFWFIDKLWIVFNTIVLSIFLSKS